jgi:arginase
VPPQRLIDLVSQLDNVVGAALTEHMPTGTGSDAADAEVIRRLAAAIRL